MAVMQGPDGKMLPIATGAAAGADSGGGGRPEMITSDTGPRPAAPKEAASLPEPKDEVEIAASAPVAAPAPEVQVIGNPDTNISDEEIDRLHTRFDQMETLIKRKLAIATLMARFDALEAWLAARFPG